MSKKKKKEPVRDIGNEIDEFECRIREVLQEEFEIYKEVKEEGEIPLYEINKISQITGIKSDKIILIQDNYSGLCKKFEIINNKKKSNKK